MSAAYSELKAARVTHKKDETLSEHKKPCGFPSLGTSKIETRCSDMLPNNCFHPILNPRDFINKIDNLKDIVTEEFLTELDEIFENPGSPSFTQFLQAGALQ